jgi:hypothetical protein
VSRSRSKNAVRTLDSSTGEDLLAAVLLAVEAAWVARHPVETSSLAVEAVPCAAVAAALLRRHKV